MDVIRKGSQPPKRMNLIDKYPNPHQFNYLRTEIKPSLYKAKSEAILQPMGRKKVPIYPECLQPNAIMKAHFGKNITQEEGMIMARRHLAREFRALLPASDPVYKPEVLYVSASGSKTR